MRKQENLIREVKAVGPTLMEINLWLTKYISNTNCLLARMAFCFAEMVRLLTLILWAGK